MFGNLEAVATYSAAFHGVAMPAGVFLTLSGVAGRIVRVTRLSIQSTATAAAVQDVFLGVGSTVWIGGTLNGPLSGNQWTAHDPVDVSSQAVLNVYTTQPSGGSGLVIRSGKLFSTATGTPAWVPALTWEFGTRLNAKCPTMLTAVQTFYLQNFGGAVAGQAVSGEIEWTESAS